MPRWVKTFIATSLLMSSHSLWSWGQPRPDFNPEQPTVSSFPLNDAQGWYTTESYLLWSPHEDAVDWADKVSSVIGSEWNMDIDLKKPDFGWYSGVRVAVGRYLPNHDKWDVSLTSTYFYANVHNESSPDYAKGEFLQAAAAPDAFAYGYNTGKNNWRLNFFTWDLSAGRNIFVSSKLTAHPFLGLRTGLIYEDQGTKFSYYNPAIDDNISRTQTLKFSGSNDFWGIGPRGGSDFNFYLTKTWMLMGSFSGSVLMGGYKVNQETTINQKDTGLAAKNFGFKVSDHDYTVRANIEGSIGMGWEIWVKQNRVRIAPSIVFEASQWFDMNQWIDLKNPSGTNDALAYYETDRRHGDLTLMGFNFNIQVDF